MAIAPRSNFSLCPGHEYTVKAVGNGGTRTGIGDPRRTVLIINPASYRQHHVHVGMSTTHKHFRRNLYRWGLLKMLQKHSSEVNPKQPHARTSAGQLCTSNRAVPIVGWSTLFRTVDRGRWKGGGGRPRPTTHVSG